MRNWNLQFVYEILLVLYFSLKRAENAMNDKIHILATLNRTDFAQLLADFFQRNIELRNKRGRSRTGIYIWL